MGFQVVDVPRRGVSTAPCLISIATKGGQRLRVSFSEALLKQLGWAEGKPVEVAIGTDADAGWIRMRPASRGTTLRRLTKKATRLHIMAALPLGWPGQVSPTEPERMLPSQHAGIGELRVKVPFDVPTILPRVVGL